MSTSPGTTLRPGVQVKLLPQDGELYVFAQSTDRVAKERAIRRLLYQKGRDPASFRLKTARSTISKKSMLAKIKARKAVTAPSSLGQPASTCGGNSESKGLASNILASH